MRSGYKLIWSSESKKNLADLIFYLEANWTEREIKNFFQKLEKIISLIKFKPQIFRVVNRKKRIRKCVVSKQISLYYRFDITEIFIVTVFDNRRNPNRLSFKSE